MNKPPYKLSNIANGEGESAFMYKNLNPGSSTTTIRQFKKPRENLEPFTRGFAGYRYTDPHMSQVTLRPPNRNSSFQQNPFFSFGVTDKTNVRLLGWPENSTGSAALLTQLETEGVIRQDPESTYVMEYFVNNITVCGVLAEVDLSGDARSRIIPHEHTDCARTMAMRKHFNMARIDIEPILLVQRMTSIARIMIDTIKKTAATSVVEQPPDLTCRIWRVTDPDLTSKLHIELGKRQTLVADGHHRLISHSSIGNILAMITDISRDSLQLGAIHRIVSRTSLQEVESRTVGVTFREIDPPDNNVEELLTSCNHHQVLITDGTSWRAASLNHCQSLDIPALHFAVASISEAPYHHWSYTHDSSEATRIAKDKQGVAFLLRPPSLALVLKHAATGRLLPEKATSFWPKPPASMVVRTF